MSVFRQLAIFCKILENCYWQKDTNDCNVTNIPHLFIFQKVKYDSCWAGICCPVKKHLDLFGGLDTSEHNCDHSNHLDVKTWYVSHVIWVCISTLSQCYMQEVCEDWSLLPNAPVHNKQPLILFLSSSLSHLRISPG